MKKDLARKGHARKDLARKDLVNGHVLNHHVKKNILVNKVGEKNLVIDLHAHGEWEWEDHLVDLLDSEDLVLDLDRTLDLDLILDLDLGEGHHVKDLDLVVRGESHHAAVKNVKKSVKRRKMKRKNKKRI